MLTAALDLALALLTNYKEFPYSCLGIQFALGKYIGNVLIDGCLLYTSDAADERSSVDLGGRRIIKKKK